MILDKMQFLLGFCFSPPIHASDDELEGYYLATLKPFIKPSRMRAPRRLIPSMP